ncbi:NmrA family transcriptional regulator [Sphingomonas koreensis]|jgi:uncharacterized protein YbjT (DUF2867 family)|uniref:NmrA family transcriptional regulator n=1 Tax=Sphingomonas koreensis TaxID=93064 RepID=A0AAJ4VA01_9SPHN|nr:NAD(P)H-binding protein [Sphingomonas koreensis]MDC7810560.1 NAD(P)H-binding protein [Sphingomonas koreensis]RSU17747.1 NmrA family transcriptional regulator [Sphingomonas koreensis]RSU21993.1 NmrA family transcriptional regulator [Sphingomonas koreensis]RSU23137.1 NmrA family transcriptional regulator [Sphingomonas koreensis]RSU31709.1 NmrA family transcriptional regulator [Sphingomonas koreensis]
MPIDISAPPVFLLTAIAPRKREGSSPTGIVGRHLARQLLDKGASVRILAEQEQLEGWPQETQVICGSIANRGDAATALVGVDRVFLAGADPASVRDVIGSAVTEGVDRIVVLSSHGSEYESAYPPESWFWLAIERAVENSGIAWTHIRPSAVMGACLEGTYPATGSDWMTSIRLERRVREPLLDRGYYPFIHEADLAGVAAIALLNDGYTGQILEAVGLPISTRSRIDAIAQAIGQEIAMEELSADQARAAWKQCGWPSGAIEVTLFALEAYASQLKELTEWTLAQKPSVEELIARPMLGFEQWAYEHAAAYRCKQ